MKTEKPALGWLSDTAQPPFCQRSLARWSHYSLDTTVRLYRHLTRNGYPSGRSVAGGVARGVTTSARRGYGP